MKGRVPRRLQQFRKVVYEPTGRKISREVGAGAIKAKYKELIRKEIERRRLFGRDAIMNELIDFTHKWKPFDAFVDPDYTKYRYSSRELYADALSALLTNPGYLRDNAPKFYEGFFNYLDRKPEMRELYERIQAEINSGAAQRSLVTRTRLGFLKREAEFRAALEKKTSGLFDKEAWGTFFIDKYFAILQRVKKAGESNIPASFNPRYKLEALDHATTEAEGYLSQLEADVLEPLRATGLSAIDMGEYLMLWRVATERAEMANPLGWTKERAEQRIEEMDRDFGPVLKEAKDAFYKLRREWFIDRVKDADMYAPELIKSITESENYATFDIVGHLEEHHGREATGHIYRQVGTFSETGNPLTATVMKDLLLMRSINRNITVKGVVEFFQQYASEEIKPADTKWNGRFHEVQESGDPDWRLVVFMQGGKAQGYYLPKWAAAGLRENPVQSLVIAKMLRASARPFKSLFTEYNPGFWLVNIIRDYKSAVKQLPGLSYRKFLPIYVKAMPKAFKSTLGHPEETVREMLKQKMLISVADYREDLPEDLQLERLLKRYNIHPTVFNSSVRQKFNRFMIHIKGLSRGFERTPKVAGYMYLRNNRPEMAPEKIAHIVRTRAGSPDFMRLGLGAPLYNNIALFSNAIKEGWRSAYESAKSNPVEYAWKTTLYNVFPKLLMFAGSMGFLGLGVKKILDRASEYDKTNYFIIPVGLDKNGKAVYFRVPQDETGRFVGGVFWKLMRNEQPRIFTSLVDYMAGQVPTVHPAAELLAATVEYASGRNPYDHFRQRPIIDERVFLAGGARKHREFAKWASNQFGGGIVYRFGYSGVEQAKTTLEKIVDAPITSNIVGRFVKVSDYGLREKMNLELQEVKALAAKDMLLMNDGLRKMLEGRGEEITDEEFAATARRIGSLGYQYQKALAQMYGNIYTQRLITSRSKAERGVIMRRMIEDNQEIFKSLIPQKGKLETP